MFFSVFSKGSVLLKAFANYMLAVLSSVEPEWPSKKEHNASVIVILFVQLRQIS